MKTMKTTVILIMHSQILSWNLKTLFYQPLERPNPLLFLVKMTRSVSHLHIPLDATKFKFHPPKTGSISLASWTSTPTMIPRVGSGEVSSKSLMSLDSHLQNPTHTKNKKRLLCTASSLIPILHFLCLYFNYTQRANLHPLTRHTNIFSCTIPVPLIALHCTISSISQSALIIKYFPEGSSTFSEHKLWPFKKQRYTQP